PTDPNNPNGPTDPNNPNGPTDPNNPNGPTDPNNPNGPTDPNNPNGPTDPNNPNGPTDPNNPNGPTDPNNPNGPTDPNNPNGPTDPNNPNGPTDPNNPNGPTDPNNPNGPTDPNNPNGPTDPNNPNGPGDPNNPTNPGGPTNPSTPSGGPSNPNGPTGTVPSNPNGPTGPGAGGRASVGLVFDGVPLVLDEGQSRNFRVRLATPPTKAVTLSVGISGVDLEVDANVAAGGTQKTVVIDPADWNKLRDVNVVALPDEDEDDSQGKILFRASGGNYEGVQDSVSVQVNDEKRRAAWLTRFARTVGLQAIEGIESRMDSANRGTVGLSARIAGRDLDVGDASTVMRPADDHDLNDDFEREDTLTLTQALSAGTSFDYRQGAGTRGDVEGMSLWGRGWASGYEGETAGVEVDGQVSTGMLGADYAQNDWIVGLVGMYSEGEGDFLEEGRLTQKEADLTTMIPWAAMELENGIRLRGALGYGSGEVRLNQTGEALAEGSLDWTMLNAGLRKDLTEVPEGGGFGLAYTTDFLWTRIRSDEVPGWGEIEGEARRIRAGIEGSSMQRAGRSARFLQKLDAGIRHDSGDAEEGWGLDVGGGLVYSDSESGLELSLKGRVLVHHREEAARDWGLSAGVEWDGNPGTSRGFSIRVHNESGSVEPDGGIKALFSDELFLSLGDASEDQGMRWRTEVAYGMAVGSRLVGSPYFEHTHSSNERRSRLGYRLDDEKSGGLDMDIYLVRRESERGRVERDHGIGGILKYELSPWN
ncbi:MAG: hypothetical protein ISN28_14420, partial [Ectothiorhodospiraceae bacterium AqS1]|nr:hypothetical protein [Ectothiorhodospiraceae bacterium AqS1]